MFYLNAFLTLITAIFSVATKHPIYSFLYFVISILFLAFNIYLLGAPLAACFEVIVYAGAIMVLFVIATLLMHKHMPIQTKKMMFDHFWAPLLMVFLFVLELVLILKDSNSGANEPAFVSPVQVSELLMIRYGIAFELVSFLLLAGLLGAYYMASHHQQR